MSPLAQTLAWSLLHFFWQGVLLWALTGLALRLARHARPELRHTLGCAALLLALLCPVLTFLHLLHSPTPMLDGFESALLQQPVGVLPPKLPISLMGRLHRSLMPILPWALGAWTLGSALLTLRLAGGWLWMQRLRRGWEPLEADWENRLQTLARTLGLGPVRAGISRRVTSPQVIGWIRPLILVPAGCLTGLDPVGLEALLVHELAHIRRRDYLVNLLQSLVECLLFYHPGVWWISQRVRLEREACCDDAAVRHCGDPLHYAETLNHLDDLRNLIPSPAQGATGGTLMLRITRLIDPRGTAPRSTWALPAVLLSLVAAAALVAQESKHTPRPTPNRAESSTSKPAKPKESAEKSRQEADRTRQEAERNKQEADQARQRAQEDSGNASSEKVYRDTSREITFMILRDGDKTYIDFRVKRATREEVDKALARIEILAKDGMNHGGGKWPLSGVPQPNEETLSFELNRMTLESIRKTL